jgi:MYXO-CTERM domain-containing protein
MRVRIAISLAIAALTAPPLMRPAQAYVRALSASGVPLYWPQSCAAVTIYLNGFSMMTSDEVAKSIAAAAHAWSPSEVTCPGPDGDGGTGHPYFEIVPSMSAGGSVPEVAYDGKNSIIFQTTTWPEDPEFIAYTQHFTGPDGAIVDTDIEINAVTGISWSNLDPGSSSTGHVLDTIDLQTAMTHEFGHFLGLAHTCFHAGVDSLPRPNDDQGQPIPDCPDPASTPGDVPQAQSVMWFFVDPGLTTKRTLAADDIHAVCDLYPAAQDPHACTLNLPDDGCGCAAGGAPLAPGATLSLLALAFAALARRRRSLRSDRDRRAAL